MEKSKWWEVDSEKWDLGQWKQVTSYGTDGVQLEPHLLYHREVHFC
jgi:hypothetical protein